MDLKGRSCLSLLDFTPAEVRHLLDLSRKLKRETKGLAEGTRLKGKTLVLVFEKPSTRTRCAFEVAALQEGGHTTSLDIAGSQMGKKESLEDSARVLGRYYDGIAYRGFSQHAVEDLARWACVPVWNALTDTDHPTQALADLFTIEENLTKPLARVKLVFAGDTRNNVARALMHGAARTGMHFVGLGPRELHPQEDTLATLRECAQETGGRIDITDDLQALEGADILYTDVWTSMGEEAQMAARVRHLAPFRVTLDMLRRTGNPHILFMHCLPSFHDFETRLAKEQLALGLDIREVDDEVFRSKHSLVFDQAENRMHTIKALLIATL